MSATITSADWFADKREIAALHGEAMRAEQRWEALLVRTYGKLAWHARYTDAGTATPDLARLCAAKRSSYEAFRRAAFPHAREG